MKYNNSFAYKRRTTFSSNLKPFLLLLFLFFGTYSNLYGQNYLIDGGENRVSTIGESVQDFVVPASAIGKTLYLGAYGADGGTRRVNEIDGSKRFIIDGGGGAYIAGEYKIGDGPNEIPVGSVIRMIIGRTAGTHTTQSVAGNGGGGGTGVLFKRPGASNSEFELLIVAGGGGGAFSDCCVKTAGGRSASTSTSGSSGNSPGDDSNEYDGGSNGEGGEGDPDELASAKAGAGGGAFSAGKAGCGNCNGGAGGGTNDPQGGRAGSNTGVNLTEPGGYGYGGGGQGSHVSGGGGGGYSGGGTNHKFFGAGGGGGSYINETYAKNPQLISRGQTESPEHGRVIYSFVCPESLGTVVVNNVENCDSPYSGSITGTVLFCNGDDYKIKILRTGGSRVYEADLRILNWGRYNLGAGNYTIELYAFTDAGTPVLRETRDVSITGTGDVTPPEALCKDVLVSANAEKTATIFAEDANDGSTDNCSIKSIKLVDPENSTRYVNELSFTIDDIGENTRTLSVEDRQGNRSNCDFTVFVDDYPTFPNGCDATVYLLPNGSRLFYPPAPEQLTNRATDLFTPDESLVYTWDKDLDRFYCEDINQINTLDITATDESGNQTTCTANITVVDTVPANVSCKDIFIDLDENGLGTIDYLELFDVVTDNCLSRSEIIDSYSWNNDLLPLSVDCSHLGTHTIELNSTTDIYGAELPKCTANITVRDPVPPVITCRDTTFVISTETSKIFTLETLPINSVSDNCTGVSDLRFSWTPHDNFRCEDLGTTIFWVQVNDENGNSARCEFNVNILEPEIEESFTCRSRSFQLNSSNNHSYTIQPGDFSPSIRSFCGISVSGAFTFSDDTDTFLDCEDIGEPNPVTLLFTPDDGSSVFTCITNVSVNEVGSPIFTCPSGIIDIDASFENCGAYFEYDYTVTDECPIDDLDIQLEEGLPSGSIFPVGWTDVKISAQDKSGNYNACNFVVRVAGPTDKPTLTCPDNFTVQIPDGACEVVVDVSPTYDFDYGCFTRNYQSSGQAMGSAFTPGTYPIEFRTQNNFTNEFSRCSFNVTVRKDETPVAICKDTTLILSSKGGVSLQSADVDGGSYGDCYEVNNWALFDGRFFTSVFNCSKVGTKEYTLRVRNTAGASSTCTTNITVVPKDPDCQEELTINLDDTGNATLTAEDIFIDDNMCSGTLSLSQTTFDCGDVGQTQVVTLTRTIREFTGQCSTTISTVDPQAICPPSNLVVSVKAILEGAYDSDVDLMHDNLRSLALLPNLEPYGVTGAMLSASVLSISGDDAIVDWVLVQLRDATDNTNVVYSRAALLQRDGDVVDLDGVSPVVFPDAAFGDYYVAILHRNHLGLMTATTQSLSNTNIAVDFTASTTTVYGSNSRIDLGGGLMAMYGSDSDGSGTVDAYDRSLVWNERNQNGYLGSDCNLDGATNASDRSAAWNNRNLGGTLPSLN